jgi:hypothetical protein
MQLVSCLYGKSQAVIGKTRAEQRLLNSHFKAYLRSAVIIQPPNPQIAKGNNLKRGIIRAPNQFWRDAN